MNFDGGDGKKQGGRDKGNNVGGGGGVTLTKQEQEYLLPHFTMLLVGKPGSGKTAILKQMLTNRQMYAGKFDYVFIVSPSYAKMHLPIKKSRMSGDYSLGWIYDKIAKINDIQYARQKLFIDDINTVPQTTAVKQAAAQSTLPSTQHALRESVQALDRSNFVQDILSSRKQGLATAKAPPSLQRRKRDAKYDAKPTGSALVTSQLVQTIAPLTQLSNKLNTPNGNGAAGRAGGGGGGGGKDHDKAEAMQNQLDTQLNAEQRRKLHVNVLFVFDDVIGDIKRNENNSEQTKLFLNRRHIVHNGTVSLCIVTQKYTLIPSRLRSSANWLVLFKLNPNEFEDVYSDAVTLSRQNWRQLLVSVFGANLDSMEEEPAAAGGKKQAQKKKKKKKEDDEEEEEEDEDEESQSQTLDIQKLLQKMRHDSLGIWIESNIFFRNFKRLAAVSSQQRQQYDQQ